MEGGGGDGWGEDKTTSTKLESILHHTQRLTYSHVHCNVLECNVMSPLLSLNVLQQPLQSYIVFCSSLFYSTA